MVQALNFLWGFKNILRLMSLHFSRISQDLVMWIVWLRHNVLAYYRRQNQKSRNIRKCKISLSKRRHEKKTRNCDIADFGYIVPLHGFYQSPITRVPRPQGIGEPNVESSLTKIQDLHHRRFWICCTPAQVLPKVFIAWVVQAVWCPVET